MQAARASAWPARQEEWLQAAWACAVPSQAAGVLQPATLLLQAVQRAEAGRHAKGQTDSKATTVLGQEQRGAGAQAVISTF
jgi:hypothetical protein